MWGVMYPVPRTRLKLTRGLGTNELPLERSNWQELLGTLVCVLFWICVYRAAICFWSHADIMGFTAVAFVTWACANYRSEGGS